MGVWLILAPFVLGSFTTSTIAAANDVALGVILIAASWWILAARTAQVPVSGFQLLCGVWLIIGPFVLQYRGLSQATLNDLIVGAIVVMVSALEIWMLARAPIKAM